MQIWGSLGSTPVEWESTLESQDLAENVEKIRRENIVIITSFDFGIIVNLLDYYAKKRNWIYRILKFIVFEYFYINYE